ncbi:MAG: hypothetical protein UR93_C0034G0007 [Berkelbacteria bacterium GW2011_GWA2_35_9]|uniref:Uncharacterized protein n=1 Tax=Berkelbacteria bacterium GW2011_GWA2_35_9 TaxID=1618333 RepID=A0A0G0FJU8_9BACT|nr:MAG: hypothetical protein UR93_C0034G0007 [Berkelbacteria bacterium GW2011_GWA2_35_9]
MNKFLITGGCGFTPVKQLTGLQNYILSRRALFTGRAEINHFNYLRRIL